MHLEHHLVGGYVRYISPHIIIIIIGSSFLHPAPNPMMPYGRPGRESKTHNHARCVCAHLEYNAVVWITSWLARFMYM